MYLVKIWINWGEIGVIFKIYVYWLSDWIVRFKGEEIVVGVSVDFVIIGDECFWENLKRFIFYCLVWKYLREGKNYLF